MERLLEEVRSAQRRSLVASRKRSAGAGGPLTPAELAELAATGYAGIAEVEGASGGPKGRLCFDGCCWPDE